MEAAATWAFMLLGLGLIFLVLEFFIPSSGSLAVMCALSLLAAIGIGFAAGLERLVLALPEGAAEQAPARAFVVAIGDDAREEAMRLLRELRRAGLSAQMEFEARGVRAQMKRADRLQARVALIVGGDELARGEITLRDMRTSEQRPVPRAGAVEAVRAALQDHV